MSPAAQEIEEWVVNMPTEAWRMAQNLEAQCKRSGLDPYLQAQIYLLAAAEPKSKALWADVWRYIETREAAGWNDRFLVVLDD